MEQVKEHFGGDLVAQNWVEDTHDTLRDYIIQKTLEMGATAYDHDQYTLELEMDADKLIHKFG